MRIFFFNFLKIKVFALLFINCTFGQNAFNDALFLVTMYDSLKENTDTNLTDIRNKYVGFYENPTYAITTDTREIYKLKSSIGYQDPGAGDNQFISTLNPFTGKLETDLYDGLTKYIAEEFRKGVTIEYMRVFEKTIGEYGELKIMFPKTYMLLKNLDPIKFGDLGSEWKETFNDDLKYLLENIINYIENSEDQKYAGITCKYIDETLISNLKKDNLFNCIYLTLDISNKIINKYHPVDLFNYLDNKYYVDQSTANDTRIVFGDIIHGLNLIQLNLRENSDIDNVKGTWITYEKFYQLLKPKLNGKGIQMFVMLLYNQDKEYWNKMKFNPKDFEIIMKNKIVPIFTIITKIQGYLNDDKLYDKGFVDFVQLILDLFVESEKLDDKEKIFKKSELEVAQITLDVYKSIHRKDYHNLVSNSIILIKKILTNVDPKLSENSKFLKIITSVSKYGEFMTGIVNAKNSDETKEVIYKFVAPSSSYLEKRTTPFTFSLSSHPGIFTGIDRLNNNDGWISGLTLPIGFECSFGFEDVYTDTKGDIITYKKALISNDEHKSGFSLSFFLQLIDIGAIFNFRLLDNSTTELPQDIKLHQIFSPGGSINVGLYNKALTFGFGYQLAPKLRKISENGFETEEKSDRIFLRLSWDLPLFIF